MGGQKSFKHKKDIINLIIQGYNNREIAEMLYLSEHTIKSYISELIAEFAVRNRTNLAYLVGYKRGCKNNTNL